MNRGFTIIELLVSIAIFVAMTALIVAKYGNFNQSTLLTDTAYDMALTMRLAQTYGLSVKNSGGGAINFNVPYGVSFNTGVGTPCGSVSIDVSKIVLFADTNPAGTPDGVCDGTDTTINSYLLTRGAKVTTMCVGADEVACQVPGNTVQRLDVSYQRPNPEAVICSSNGGAPVCGLRYAEVTIQGVDGSTRAVSIHQNGQVSVIK